MPRGAGTVTRPLDTLSLPSSGLLDHERSLGGRQVFLLGGFGYCRRGSQNTTIIDDRR